jgi:hypothetical protein
MTLTFASFEAGWWPYLFIFVAGVLATDIWRWLGVVAGGALREDSQALLWVRAVATALVASVVGQLILFPTGDLAATPAALRIAAAALGWLAFWFSGKSPLVGVGAAEAVLVGGWLALE